MKVSFLMFEDNTALREALVAALNERDEVVCIGNYEHAINATEHVRELKPDVILMDIDMPGINGIEAVKQIKSQNIDVEIIMFTVFDENDKVFDAICAGATGYLLKNSSTDKIAESIVDVAKGGAPMSAVIARKILFQFPQFKTKGKEKFNLSDREIEILNLLVKGKSYKTIAQMCFISHDTVRTHIKHIYEKLQVHSAPEAVAIAMEHRLVN